MKSAYDIVKISRDVSRPTSRKFIEEIFDNFIELHGDRFFADDNAIIGGVCLFKGQPVTVIGIQKGNTLEENLYRNFGQVKPEGYRKALRLMKQAEKFGRPIICFINTPGAYCGVDAEERGQGEAIANNLYEMATLKVPIISIIIGEGGSGGALALGVSDNVWILENATYSILSPEGFATILWKDSKKAKEAAEFMKMTSYELLELEVVDKVIKESENGLSEDFALTKNEITVELEKTINTLKSLSVEQLLENRYARFRKFGQN